MKKTGRQLDFICLINRDGSGVIPAGTTWTPDCEHAKTDDLTYLDNEIFELNVLSLSEKTYIANGFNSWVVRVLTTK